MSDWHIVIVQLQSDRILHENKYSKCNKVMHNLFELLLLPPCFCEQLPLVIVWKVLAVSQGL